MSIKTVNKEEILNTMENLALVNNVELTENASKIANAKDMFFNQKGDSFLRCPCDAKNPKRFCISAQCLQDIQNDGVCHCNCYKKKS